MDVKPGHQRKGIGTMLIQKEFEHLKEIGCKGVMLTVSPSRIGANSFYEKNGMELIGNEGANVRGKKL
jgi:ribosomal protein S18 acetylase RimI-like enzyme